MENKPGQTPAALVVDRTNTILYCLAWSETVAFYRDVIGLGETFANDWFVEFAVGDSHISIANAERATVAAAAGAGITLTWQVADLGESHRLLASRGAVLGDIHTRWGARAFHFFDPAGHRIECWSES